MKRLVVLGGGTAGTMVVNKLHKKLNAKERSITLVDKDNDHLYQPGLLLLPSRVYQPDELLKKRDHFIPSGVEYIRTDIDKILPESNMESMTETASRAKIASRQGRKNATGHTMGDFILLQKN